MVIAAGASDALWQEFLALCEGPDDDFDEYRADQLVAELNRRAEPDLVAWALPLLTSDVSDLRWAAAWALQDHGVEAEQRFTAEVTPALAAAARIERDDDVRATLVAAIGRADDPAWLPELTGYADDPAPAVRHAVAANLPFLSGDDHLPHAAVRTLITLSRDRVPEVRDWATMSLGSDAVPDTAEVRTALRARLDDDEDGADARTDTSGEALRALAQRRDPVVRERLVTMLRAPVDEIGNLIVEAAGELGDADLLPLLQSVRDRGWAERPDEGRPIVLAHAIEALTAAGRGD